MPLPGRRRKRSGWSPPPPRCAFVVRTDAVELPSILEVVNAKAAEGALEGSPLEAEEETMTGLESPMPVGGRYWVTSPRGDLFAVAVAGRPDGGFAIEVSLDAPGPVIAHSVVYGTQLAARICRLTNGVAEDEARASSFDGSSWRVDAALAGFDAAEHVTVRSDEPGRARTWGLTKFGRPELALTAPDAEDELRRLAQEVVDGRLIWPGDRVGRRRARQSELPGEEAVLELVEA